MRILEEQYHAVALPLPPPPHPESIGIRVRVTCYCHYETLYLINPTQTFNVVTFLLLVFNDHMAVKNGCGRDTHTDVRIA